MSSECSGRVDTLSSVWVESNNVKYMWKWLEEKNVFLNMVYHLSSMLGNQEIQACLFLASAFSWHLFAPAVLSLLLSPLLPATRACAVKMGNHQLLSACAARCAQKNQKSLSQNPERAMLSLASFLPSVLSTRNDCSSLPAT